MICSQMLQYKIELRMIQTMVLLLLDGLCLLNIILNGVIEEQAIITMMGQRGMPSTARLENSRRMAIYSSFRKWW